MRRFIRIPIIPLCFACLLLAAGPCIAQSPAELTLSQAESMPRWAVPVLRLVSATHVEPTTGVVISDSGLVLVPVDFASFGDEIIVLDGGTDIIRNGRPAKITQRFPEEGLQVLSVKALQRKGAGFSAAMLTDGSEVRLSAFPPAEMIAQGAPPLDIPATVTILSENGRPGISGQSPLPNVTGALLDECGMLAGYSSADGVQSMSMSETPGYQWKETLKRLMIEMQLEPRITDCSQRAGTVTGSDDETALPEVEDIVPEPGDDALSDEPEPDSDHKLDSAEDSEDPGTSPEIEADDVAGEELPQEAEQLPDDESLVEMVILPPYEEESMADASAQPAAPESPVIEQQGVPAWLWLLAAVLLIGAGLVLHRIRNSKAGDSTVEAKHPTVLDPSVGGEEEADPEYAAPGLDSHLRISGLLTDGTAFEASCKVSSHAINLVIGRGNADLIIDSAAVSRRHASMNGADDLLTLSDLGSSNGTSINGVPCLEGETMFIRPGDMIVLGNARFSYEVLPGPATDSQAQE